MVLRDDLIQFKGTFTHNVTAEDRCDADMRCRSSDPMSRSLHCRQREQ